MFMTITSTAFQNNDPIPREYGFGGRNVNPPLTFSEVPVETRSLVLIVEDLDAPGGIFTHWILYNMSPATLQIMEDSVPAGAAEATNDYGSTSYGGPNPPSGTHRYVFKLFALDTTLKEIRHEDKSPEVYTHMEGHVIDKAQIVAKFSA